MNSHLFESINQLFRDCKNQVSSIFYWSSEFKPGELIEQQSGSQVPGPVLHKSSQQIEIVHHNPSSGWRSFTSHATSSNACDRVLSPDHVIFQPVLHPVPHHLSELGWKHQVFEISKTGVASHFPSPELNKCDTIPGGLLKMRWSFKAWTVNVHLVAAPCHGFDQINRFDRSSARGRIKGFVC